MLQCLRRCIISRDPIVSIMNWLHIYICLYQIQEYSAHSSKWVGKFPEVLNVNQVFLKRNQFICNWL